MSEGAYLTEQNLSSKLTQWKKLLSPFSKRWKKLEPRKTALLVIDMQNYFLDEKSHAFVPSSKIITKNLQKIINFYRAAKLPVIFTYFAVTPDEPDEENPIGKWWNDVVHEGSPESQIAEELKPQTDETLIRKNSYSAFHKTDLENILKAKNINNLVIAGVLTNLCCETAAREAFVGNLNVFFLIDGTAAYNEEMHLSSLKNLAYGFATPITTEDLIK